MATPYVNINTSFLSKISDPYLLSMTDQELEELLLKLLNNSIPKFRKCKTDLSERDTDGFLEDLKPVEIEILANLMVQEWLRPQVNNLEIIRQSLGTRDFNMFSQANHLKELQNLRKETQIEIDKMLVDYTYQFNKLDDLQK